MYKSVIMSSGTENTETSQVSIIRLNCGRALKMNNVSIQSDELYILIYLLICIGAGGVRMEVDQNRRKLTPGWSMAFLVAVPALVPQPSCNDLEPCHCLAQLTCSHLPQCPRAVQATVWVCFGCQLLCPWAGTKVCCLLSLETLAVIPTTFSGVLSRSPRTES